MSDEKYSDDAADDDHEVFPVEDNYKRTNANATIASLLNNTFGEALLDASKYTNEWWVAREQRLANEHAKDASRTERARMRQRADLLTQTEGAAGVRGRFPRWAIEGAQKHDLRDTLAMTHGRKFADADQLVAAAETRRRMGERDDDDAPAPGPSMMLVLAGGTGAGKTTVASWIALKGTDAMPGFIRASELEGRGRYDKDLRAWIPERTTLVIDDLGAELLDGKGVFRSLLDEIVDTLYSSKRRLIITTNLRPKIDDAHREECKRDGREPEPQFRERYGDRVRSRVVQVGQWADCGNTDLREVAP